MCHGVGEAFQVARVDLLDVREVPDERVEFALKRKDLRLGQFEACEFGNVAHLVEGDGHGASVAQAPPYSKQERLQKGDAGFWAKMWQRPMRKPSFGVVTLTVGLLSAFGVVAHHFRPLIPPPAENRMAAEASEYLRQAAAQRIDWHPLDDAAFAEARRQGLPVLLAIGTPWSAYGRFADARVFTHADVEAYLSRRFVCVRVDATQEPRLLDAYLPVTRYELNMVPDFQVWLLDPTGQMFELVVRTDTRRMDAPGFLNTLIAARERMQGPHGAETQGTPAYVQRQDLRALSEGSPLAQPSFSQFLEFLTSQPDVARDPLRDLRYRSLTPQSWMYLIRTGRPDLAEKALADVFRSPMVDWLDGGFHHRGVGTFDTVEFDQIATLNAEMVEVCAMVGILTRRHAALEMARSTFDALLGRFSERGLVRACRIGTTGPLDRSTRSSFAPRELREIFPDGAEREKVRNLFGLRVETNPQMVVRARSLEEMQQPEAQAALERLREFEPKVSPRYAGSELMDVNGHVAARLMASARLMGDVERLGQAGALVDRLDAFRSADDIAHTVDRRRVGEPFLGDYAAYADAALQDYLATGRAVSLRNGLAVLKRAVFLFDLGDGVFGLGFRRPGPLAPQVFPTPGLGDDVLESASARMIRLLCAYGRLLPEETATGADGVPTSLLSLARAGVGHFAVVAGRLGVSAGGYYRAALELFEDTYALAVGPEAQRLSDELLRLAPSRFIAPAFGRVRPDVQARSAGLYVVSGTSVQGPFTPAEAAARFQRVRLVGG